MIIAISGKIGSGKDTVGKIIQYLTYNKDRIQKGFKSLPFSHYDDGNPRNKDWQIKKFAYAVKQVASIFTGIPIEDFEKEDVKNSNLDISWSKLYCKTCGSYENNPCNRLCNDCSEILVLKPMTIGEFIKTIEEETYPYVWVNALMNQYKNNSYQVLDVGGQDTVYVDNYPNWIITDLRFPNEAKAVKDRKGIIIRVNSTFIKYSDGSYRARNPMMGDNHPSETALDNYKFDYTIDNNGTIEELVDKVKQILIKEKIL